MNLVIVWTMRFSIDYRSSFIINTDIEFAPHILGNTIFHIIIIQYIHQFIHVIIETLIQIPAIFEGAELLPLPPEVPGMSKVPDPIHPALRQLLVNQRPDWMSDNWRALLKASLPTAWQQARGRPMDPVRRAITSFAESLIWPTYRQARTASSSLWLSCRSGCLTQPPSLTSQRSGTYISQRGTETHWPTPHVLTWY